MDIVEGGTKKMVALMLLTILIFGVSLAGAMRLESGR